MIQAATLKTVIAFFYMLNGETVSYTVSDYGAFQEDAGIRTEWNCEQLIQDPGFAEDVRSGFATGESMRAECYRSEDIRGLGTPYSTVTITPK